MRPLSAGALVVTWAVIAFGDVARPMRLLNSVMGIWIAAAPRLFSGATGLSRWTDLVVGGLLIVLSILVDASTSISANGIGI